MARDAAAAPERRPLRRDAELNRQRILAAARLVFARRGLAATLDDVAVEAGVGVGTVYRRFPTRASLADELFTDTFDGLCAYAEQCAVRPDPGAALLAFLEYAGEQFVASRGLREVAHATGTGCAQVECVLERLTPVVAGLVERAVAAGDLRPDVSWTDVPVILEMLGAVADFGHDVAPELWRRYLGILLDGLHAPGSAGRRPGAFPVPPLSADQVRVAKGACGAR